METQFGRKPPLSSSLSSVFIIKKTSYNYVLAQTHTSTQAPTCRRLQPSLIYQPLLEGSYNPLISFTSLSWKGATNPCSHLPATTGRELQPPALIYQPLLEGSDNPLLSFTSLSWKGATTPCSRLPATTGRELQPPALIYQLPLEESYNPLTKGFDP